MNNKPSPKRTIEQLVRQKILLNALNKQETTSLQSKKTPSTPFSSTPFSFTTLKTQHQINKLNALNTFPSPKSNTDKKWTFAILFLILLSLSTVYLVSNTTSQLANQPLLTGAAIAPTDSSSLGITSEGYSLSITAASPGPDNFGYQSVDAIPYAFDDISATGTLLFLADDASANVDMGMNFTLYGSISYNTTNISSNGFLTFGDPGTAFSNANIPNTAAPNYLIAPFWDDLNPATAGKILYQTKGSAPDRKFIVQWHQIPPFDPGGTTLNVTFQVILYETTNHIRFYYNDTVIEGFDNSNGASATIGIENEGGTDGLVYSFNTASLHNGSSILFYRCDSCQTCQDALNVTGATIRLNNTLRFANASCISIGTGNITLNGLGFSIIGNGTGTAIDDTAGHDNLTINNLISVTSVTIGVGLTDVDTSIIHNNTFDVKSDAGNAAIDIVNSNNTNISWNTITQNGSYLENGSAINLETVYNSFIDSNSINTTAVGSHAILYTTGNASIRNNNINTTSQGASGIALTNMVKGTSVIENRITSSGSGSFFGGSTNTFTITTSNDLIIRSNTIKSLIASSTAMTIDTVNNSLFDNNTIENLVAGAIDLIGITQNNVLVNNNLTAPSGEYEIVDSAASFGNDTTYYNYLIYNNSFGEIAWQNNGTGSLLHEMRITVTGGSLNLGETIFIGNNTASIDTSAFTPLLKFNSSANITLRGLDLSTVGRIYKVGNFTTNSTEIRSAGVDCNASGGCSILNYFFGTLKFNTTGFSSFTAATTSSCGTIATTTTLLNSVSSAGTCFTINASNITLDCANYLINYSTIGEFGHGINITGFNNITIKNCIIREASVNTTGKHAINLLNSSNITIWNNVIQTIAGSSSAIAATDTLILNISNNVMYSNGSSAHVISLVTSDNATIFANLINATNDNANAYGINLGDTGNNTIAFNVIKSNSTALYISGKSNNNMSYNNLTSTGNPGAGSLSLIGVNLNKIHFNQINSTGASVYGIYTNPSSHNVFGENIIRTKETTSDNNAYFFRISDNITITRDNIAASASSNQIRLQDSNVTLINMTFNKYNLSFDDATSGTLTVQWNLYVNVSNNTGSALTNANVTIFNVSSILEQSAITGSTGSVTFTVTEFRQTATEKIFSTPHTINTTNSTYIANSTTINISNSNSTFQNVVLSFAASNTRPTAPPYIQIDYRNLTATTNRTPIFIWQNATDTDGDIFSYHIQVDDNAIFNNPEINVTAIAPTAAKTNTTYYTTITLNVDTRYFWRVRANDSTGYGNWSNGASTDGPSSNSNISNFTVDSLLQLTLTNNAVEFGIQDRGANISSATSTADTILPLRAENTGNIYVNITLNATALFSSVNMNTSSYQFRMAENESNAFSIALSSLSWINMTTSTSAFHLVNLSWENIKNDFLIDLNVSLPYDEPAGLKASTITVTVTSNE